MRPIGTAQSLFVQTPALEKALSNTGSAVPQSTALSTAPAQQGRIVPNNILLNKALVQVGGWKPLEEPADKILMPYLFRPEGKVEEKCLPNGDTQCSYQVAHVPGDPSNPFKAIAVYDHNRQLKNLSAESTSNTERKFPRLKFFPKEALKPLITSNIQHQSDLLSLPNEMLDRIAKHTDPNGKIALRQTNWHFHSVVDGHITPNQRFLINHGQICEDLGLNDNDIKKLLEMPADQREFIVSHGHALKDAGVALLSTANRPPSEREFIAINGKTLKEVGFSSWRIFSSAKLPAPERAFIAAHAKTIKNLGGLASDILGLVKERPDVRDFVANNGQTLKNANYGFYEILFVAKEKTSEQRDFIAAKAHKFKNAGYSCADTIVLGDQPADVRNFIENNALHLFKANYSIYAAIDMAKKDDRESVLQNLE